MYPDEHGPPVLDSLLRDVRYGIRALLRSPGFALVAVVSLALGIGANTTMFSVANAVLYRPLPFADPDRLVVIHEQNTKRQSQRVQFLTPGAFSLLGVQDPLTFVMVSVVMMAVALLSCYVPARRATAVDPANVLRTE